MKERGMSGEAGKTGPEHQGFPVHPIEKNIALRFDRVSFSYEGVRVLENASFHIHQGEFVALVGPNGSGKTTVLKLLLGLETPRSGSIELFGASGGSRRRGRPGLFSSLRDRVGYVPQQAQADRSFPITVEEVVRMGRLKPLSRKFRAGDKAAAAAAMERMEIAGLAGRLYNALSGGQRRRVLVARALASLAGGEGGILVLDEPAANMDAESEDRLFKTLGNLKGSATILIVTHDRDFVSSLTDRVLCIDSRGGEGVAIVQHPLEAGSAGGREGEEGGNPGAPGGRFRVLHHESIPADICCGREPGGSE
jgi:zinc transport system ATP-binding protein